jgi:quinol monooxygenase YgiN
MPKVIFNIQYEIPPGKKEDYLSVIKELKSLLNAEGLESYSVYETKGKNHHYQEQYVFISTEAYEAFDDDQNERINLLINKLNDMTVEGSTKYTTLYEITDNNSQ